VEKEKKRYTRPTLVEYGRMEQLTRGPLGGSFDSIIGRTIGIGSVGGGFGPLEDWFLRSR
jgi:hypothetical protein